MEYSKLLTGDDLCRQDVSIYPLRALAHLGVALILLTGWLENHFQAPAILLAFYMLLFPHISHFLAGSLKQSWTPGRIHSTLLMADSFGYGVAIGVMSLSLIPALALLALLLFYLVLRNQLIQAIQALVMVAAGCGLVFLVAGFRPVFDTPLYTALVSLLCMMIELALVAYTLRKHNQQIANMQELYSIEQEKQASLAKGLAKYLSPQVWHMAFSGQPENLLKTQRKKLTVFFSDIKDFTDLSEELEPEDLAEILNGYLSEMSEIAIRHGGTIDKFIGDSIMVFFGDPYSKGSKNDAMAAVSMALEMRRHMKVLRQQWQAQGINKRLEIRMGINTGYCTVGTFGADTRRDYTVIGREVNLASRLENAAGSDEILVSGETYSLVKDEVMGRDKGNIQVKGFARPVQIYQIIDYRRDLGPSSSYLAHELDGFSIQLDTGSLSGEDIDRVIEVLYEALGHLQE